MMLKRIILKVYGHMKMIESRLFLRAGITEEELYAVRFEIMKKTRGNK